MTRIFVTSPLPRDGKSTVAAGLAAALRATGAPVRLVRLPGGATEGDDAAIFGRLQGVRANAVPETLPSADTDHTVVEVPDPAACAALGDAAATYETEVRQLVTLIRSKLEQTRSYYEAALSKHDSEQRRDLLGRRAARVR